MSRHIFEEEFEELAILEEEVDTDDQRDLMVFNDDFNTFEHVINTLVKVCKHSLIQAEQCTHIIHYRGKCSVKKGSLPELKPLKEGICEAGINAEIV
ncbi:ATP-dependent Clp protease adaptor ClpS [Roseivirga sp. BDSF3-8]|uniref:ATP-dependent Clp protease adaptor ClpS n=1 Tax=Roseivirga sp. BDSF3-8 TaxID=3241598 RepID=UPI003531D56A